MTLICCLMSTRLTWQKQCIKEYVRSCWGVMRMPLAYIKRMAITVQVYGDVPSYITPNKQMIARMLHLPTDKNKLHNEWSAQSIKEHTSEYEMDNRSVYGILDQTCYNIDLYPYVKGHKSKRLGRGIYYAIHSMWLGLNHVNATASKTKMTLQMSTYDR